MTTHGNEHPQFTNRIAGLFDDDTTDGHYFSTDIWDLIAKNHELRETRSSRRIEGSL